MRALLHILNLGPRPLGIAILALSVAAAFGASRLAFDDVPSELFRSDDETFRILDSVQRDFSTDENDCVVLIETDDVFAPAAVEGLRAIAAAVGEVDGVESVISLVDVPVLDSGWPRRLLPPAGASEDALRRAREEALSHPLVAGQLVTDEADATLIIVRMPRRTLGMSDLRPVVREIDAAVSSRAAAHGLRARLTGIPAIRVEIIDGIRRDQIVMTSAGVVISALIAVALLRSLPALILAGTAPLVGLLWVFGLLGALGIEVDVISNVLPTLMLVIGFADSVHLALEFRGQREAGMAPRLASLATVRHLGAACAITSLTTAIGFGSLGLADVYSVQRFGLIAALGAVVMFVAVVTVLPVLGMTKLGEHVGRRAAESSPSPSRPDSPGLWRGVARASLSRPRLVVALGVAATAWLLTVALRLEPDNHLGESIPEHFESNRALMACDEQFDGILEAQVLLEWDGEIEWATLLGALRRVHGVLDAHEVTSHPLSVVNVVESLPPALRRPPLLEGALAAAPAELVSRFLRRDLGRALVRAHVRDRLASLNEPQFRAIEADLGEVAESFPGVRFALTGTVVVISRKVTSMILEFGYSLFFAAVLIFGLMTAAFRSVRLGLISVVPNVFPMALTASFVVWMGWPLLLSTALVFSVSLGVAVDDTVHLIARFQRERREGWSADAALRRSIVAVGRALLVTTLVFCGGFGCVFLSEIDVLRTFGLLAIVAFVSALVGDLILLPALLLVFCGGDGGSDRPGNGEEAPPADGAEGPRDDSQLQPSGL